jgi:aspartyl-tRNA(Asn)/glutamyl-tRNA(Gln) amidotransferase subunit A
MARSVRDAALMLSVMAGYDAADPFSLPEPGRDFLDGIEDGVAGLRIGILRHPGFAAQVDEDGLVALEAARLSLEGQGAKVVELAVDLPDISAVFSQIWGVALARAVETVAADKRELIDAGLRGVADRFGGTSGVEVMRAEAMRVQAAHVMAALEVDAILCPAVPHCAPLAGAEIGDPVAALWQDWAPWTILFNLTRQPAIALPMGVNAAGLPTSVQIAAGIYRDDVVLRVARAVERGLG